MNKDEIQQNLIFLMVRGSQAYGTNTAESDFDYGGICMPSDDVLYGIDKFEQDEDWVDETGEKVDKSIYVFSKAIDLLTENNPNMLDYLCVPDRCVVKSSAIWDLVRDNADLFISRDTKNSFLGYALAQLGRIKTHRTYLLNPQTEPKRENYGLPAMPIFPETQYESIAKMASQFIDPALHDNFNKEMSYMLDTEGAFIVKKYVDIADYRMAIEFFKVRQEQFLRMIASINGKFLAPEYHDMAKRELKYIADMRNYKRYQAWAVGRNDKRRALEEKCGYDAKHGMHLLRLTRMAAEIMEGKGIIVDRTNIDAQELLDIRLGNQSYETVLAKANEAEARANSAYKTSTLQDKPDYNAITELKRKILHDWFN